MLLCNMLFIYLVILLASAEDQSLIYRRIMAKNLAKQKEIKRQVAIERSHIVSELEAYICNPSIFPYISCYYNNMGDLESSGGTFGVGIKADLLLYHPDILIYKGCKISSKLEIECSENNLLRSLSKVRVFIKRENSKLESQYKSAYSNYIPITTPQADIFGYQVDLGFLMEKYMSSYIPYKFQGLQVVSPAIYTIMNKKRQLVSELNRYIFMEFLEGMTLSDLLGHITRSEKYHMKNGLKMALRCYRNFIQSQNNPNHDAKTTRRKEMLLRISINNAIGNIFGRFRYRISLIDHTLNFLQRIWEQNIYHCDLTYPNIMILEEHSSDKQELAKIIQEGQGFLFEDDKQINMMDAFELESQINNLLYEKIGTISNFSSSIISYTGKVSDMNSNISSLNNLLSGTSSFPHTIVQDYNRSSSTQGLRYIRFKPENFRIVDLSFAIDANRIMKKMKDHEKYFIETPCRIQAPDRTEDLVQLRDFLDKALYFDYRVNKHILDDIWSSIIKELMSDSELLEFVEKSLITNKTVVSHIKHFNIAIQASQRYFKELRSNIYNSEWISCYENSSEWRRMRILDKISLMSRDRIKFSNSCNIKDMTIAIHKAREQLHYYADRFKQVLFSHIYMDATNTMNQYYSVSVAPQYLDKKLKDIINLGLYKIE
ncbi:hypothetical protein ACR3K2_23340 [Cryptosporidium serpentis]